MAAERELKLVVGAERPPAVARVAPFRFAEDAAMEAVLQAAGRRCLAVLLRNEPAALAGKPEAIHQMRVALRRLRSALAAAKPMLPRGAYQWAAGALKTLAAPLGAPRDWDVFAQELLPPVIEALPEEEALRALAQCADSARRAAYDAARPAIAAPERRALAEQLAQWFETRGWRDGEAAPDLLRPAKDAAPALLARRLKAVRKRGKHVATLSPAERHRLRIAVKKLRYTAELFAGFFDADKVAAYLAPLKALQDDLGHANDVRTTQAILARLGEQGADAALGRAAGIVLGWHERGLVEGEERLRKHVRRFRRTEPFW